MLHPILPPIAKIDKKKNDWAVKRLDNCFPKNDINDVYTNYNGVKIVDRKQTECLIVFYYVYTGPCVLLMGSFYECFGICCCLRRKYLEEVNIYMRTKPKESSYPISFDPFKIKILRLYYEGGDHIKLNLSKFKSLVELLI